ncbi:MAG: glycosyltransferase family 4 protein [Vicingaceae bacterium]
MKVLQICLKPPFPEVDGGCKAMNAFTQGFIDKNIDLKVLSISTAKHPFLEEKMTAEYLEKTKIEHVFVDTKVKAFDAFKNLASQKSYNIERFYNEDFEKLIIKTLENSTFDIVLLESLYVSKYVKVIRKKSNAKIVLRAHNVESALWKRNASNQKGLKKAYVNSLVKKLDRYEKQVLNSFDGIAAITREDKVLLEDMGCKIPIMVFPFGINLNDYVLVDKTPSKNVFHIGSMDWLPNQNAVKWFLEKVWDKVLREVPDAKLNLAGREMPDWITSNPSKNIKVYGRVDSAIDFINNNDVMVVPLLTGGGMRVKIIEGMVLRKTIVSTSIGAEGIAYNHNTNILIADTPSKMAQAIVTCLNNTNQQEEIGKAARELMERDYDNQIIVANLLAFFKQL